MSKYGDNVSPCKTPWAMSMKLVSSSSFFLLTLFTVCNANLNCLFWPNYSFFKIWSWMYSRCTFWHVLILSRFSQASVYWHLLSFLLLSNDAFQVISFSLISIGSQETLHLAVTKFHIRHSENIFPISPEEYKICFLQLPYNNYLYHY